MEFVLEACVDSLESALEAKAGGATRLELCANLLIGGNYPCSFPGAPGKGETGLPVHALLRPRFGDFLYSDGEWSMDGGGCCRLAGSGGGRGGFRGSHPGGDLDGERISRMVSLAHRAGKRFTLHRAFDLCRDPLEALEQCNKLGVDILLTSGQKNTCVEGLPLLKELWERAGQVELLIGAGVDAQAIRQVRQELPGARCFHMSGKKVVESAMLYRKEGVSMGLPTFSEYEIWRTDREKIRLARKELMQA